MVMLEYPIASGKRQCVRRLRPPWMMALMTDMVSPMAEAAPMRAAARPTVNSDHVCERKVVNPVKSVLLDSKQ